MIGKALALHFSLPEVEDILLLKSPKRLHPSIPRIMVFHDDKPMLKSPQELETSKSRYRGKKVIFLVRDPRDVIVSSYFEFKKRGAIFGINPYERRKISFRGDLRDFIHRSWGGFDTILKYYNIWAENRHLPKDFLLVRYEDIKRSPGVELRRVLDFLGLPEIPDETIAEAVKFASFENMQKMEKEGKFQSGVLTPGDKNDRDSYKTRKGKTQGYKDYLNDDEIEELNNKMRTQLSEFLGYTV